MTRARIKGRARTLERVSIVYVITNSRRKPRVSREHRAVPEYRLETVSNRPETGHLILASAHVDAARHRRRRRAAHVAQSSTRVSAMSSFALARDAKIASPATTLALCPTMDVVVVACALGRTLTAYRLNWNKLWTKALDPERETPTRVT